MRIGMTYDLKDDYLAKGMSPQDAAEFDSRVTIDAIASALEGRGHTVERIGSLDDLVPALAADKRWDMVFNIAEGVHSLAREAQVPALLDAYAIPYVFSDPVVLGLTLHKGFTKHVIANMGLPTPLFAVVNSLADLDAESSGPLTDMAYPLFAKPVAEGTSKGITAASKIRGAEELRRTCADLLQRFRQPVLVEEYLPGREFTVGLIGTGSKARVLGVLEVGLVQEDDGGVYGYEAKADYAARVEYRLAADNVAKRAGELALACWQKLGCRDGGRVDLRCGENGRPQIMEVNPLPGLHPVDSDLPILARLLGMSYAELIGAILDSALNRTPTCEAAR